ncbi:MAG: hypothetical protein HFG27_00475, partial [Provencibacterium sp.]|nr:hypothetical protein [Provencibacterium sp.]
LKAEGIKARVVSVTSLGLFADQPEDYRLSVIPADARVFGRQGKKIEILVNFCPKLHYVSEWWKQLYGESEGKDWPTA